MAINTLYIDNGILKSASKTFNNQNPRNIRLEKFFQAAVFELLQRKLYNSKYSLKFHPYKYKYLTTKSKEVDSFLNGRYFQNIINSILKINKYKIEYEIRKFEPGNYTLLHDTEKEQPGIDFIIDFSGESKTYHGGYTTYLTESEELLQLKPAPNTLSFIERKKGVMKYTKYFTHQNKYSVLQVVGSIFGKHTQLL